MFIQLEQFIAAVSQFREVCGAVRGAEAAVGCRPLDSGVLTLDGL